MFKKYLVFYILLCFNLQSCTILDKASYKYNKINLVGDSIDTKIIKKLKIGMSKEEVFALLGKPIVYETNENKITYYTEIMLGKKTQKRRQLNIYFKNNLVIKYNQYIE